ncbi:maleylpyruvate isomerase N-terminal domain-containing protein [Streptomyces sp. TLI_171]|uniref:maleylpyruvate isomerase N-terminal domain-containing protein n=1 Tax=Streptomyces sp. TLI_171 TaxID=1938859 RepID=UPI000C18B767|nr:maleylpyruvate isomerase N-terminal domain-containing protein [Streptomyces sp. TLI_171]RKE17031.1 uncharacterized protein (TIGR03083 family) [Streptomyces sp. TLI_171]
MDKEQVERAFAAESAALQAGLAGVAAAEWGRATRCAPWTVGELLAHVRVAVGRVPGMLDAPEPERAEVSAAGYYRADERFDAATNGARIALARDHAADLTDGPALLADFGRTWQQVDLRCRAEPPGRVVRTRHGDPMLLTDFLTTRVVELAVHGLDLADALERAPWLTGQAADLLEELLLGHGDGASVRAGLGWDRPGFLRRATGRAPLTAAERAAVDRAGVTWLTLG